MLRTGVLVVTALILGGLYAVMPLWTAFDLKRAVKQGDLATLEVRVDWANVRTTLKASLAEIEREKEAQASLRGLPRPSLWQRIKAAASPSRFADQLIDRYVTPEGVVSASRAGGTVKAWFQRRPESVSDTMTTATAVKDVPDELLPIHERALRFWNRLKRVTFVSPTIVELEVQDKYVAERNYVGTIELVGWGWRVTSLRVIGTGF